MRGRPDSGGRRRRHVRPSTMFRRGHVHGVSSSRRVHGTNPASRAPTLGRPLRDTCNCQSFRSLAHQAAAPHISFSPTGTCSAINARNASPPRRWDRTVSGFSRPPSISPIGLPLPTDRTRLLPPKSGIILGWTMRYFLVSPGHFLSRRPSGNSQLVESQSA